MGLGCDRLVFVIVIVLWRIACLRLVVGARKVCIDIVTQNWADKVCQGSAACACVCVCVVLCWLCLSQCSQSMPFFQSKRKELL